MEGRAGRGTRGMMRGGKKKEGEGNTLAYVNVSSFPISHLCLLH
jgi:hypothetical protein